MNEPNEARGNAHFLTSVHSLSWKVPWQQPGLPTPCDLLCVTSPNPTENRYFYLQTCKCQSVKSFWSLEKMTQTSIKRRFCSSASYITDLKPTDGHFIVYYLKVWWEHLKKQNITTVLFKWLHTHIFFSVYVLMHHHKETACCLSIKRTKLPGMTWSRWCWKNASGLWPSSPLSLSFSITGASGRQRINEEDKSFFILTN